MQQIYGLHTKINSSYRWIIGNITNITNFAGAIFYLTLTPNTAIYRNLTSLINASSTSASIFYITNNDWKYATSTLDGKNYYYIGNDTPFKGGFVGDDETIYLVQNETFDSYSRSLYNSQNTVVGCTPNWTRQETSCYANDTKFVFYNDSNSCSNITGKPNSSISVCDYNLNGVMGNLLSNSLNLSVYIAGSLLNSSANYSNSSIQRLVEIKDNGKTIVSFKY